MVYCDYVESRGTKVVYAIGGSTDDITGRLEIDLSDDSFEVTSPPTKSQVYLPHIAAMLRKNLPDFKRGTFKKKMSYEI